MAQNVYEIKSRICASEDDSDRTTSQQSFYCKFDFVSECKCCKIWTYDAIRMVV